MKWKCGLLLICFLAVGLSLYHQKDKKVLPPMEEETIYVEVSTNQGVKLVSLDEYLIGVVAGEMPLSFEDEALKAQIVASRTFAFSRGLKVDDTTSSQVYLSNDQLRQQWKEDYEKNYLRLKRLVQETKQDVLTYQGNYISALFFSSSNGYTENNEDYFNVSATPYLRSKESHWDLTIDPYNQRIKEYTIDELEKIFGISPISFVIQSYKTSGRVAYVKVGETTYTGREIREKLGLASSDFTIEKQGDHYIFQTSGYGHGVGMSQYGAQGMALEGYTYQDILLYYYENVEIEQY